MIKIRAKYEIPKRSVLEQALLKFQTTKSMSAYYKISTPTMARWLKMRGLKSVEKTALEMMTPPTESICPNSHIRKAKSVYIAVA
jgi:hypothetical protein